MIRAPLFPIDARDGRVSVAALRSLDLATAFVVVDVVSVPQRATARVTLTLAQAMALHKTLGERIDHVATLIALKDELGRSAA